MRHNYFFKWILFIVICATPFLVVGQCTNTSSFGSASAGTGTVVTISTSQWAIEYATVSGITAGFTYRFTSSVASDYITVRSGSYDGIVVGSGQTPLTVPGSAIGTYYVHFNTNSSCGTASVSRTSTVQRVAAGCTNTSMFPGSAVSVASSGTTTITTCQYASEYNQLIDIINGATYKVTSSTATDFVTVRVGSSSGAVLVAGVQPVTFTTTSTSDLFVHYNSNSACATATGCRTTTITPVVLPSMCGAAAWPGTGTPSTIVPGCNSYASSSSLSPGNSFLINALSGVNYEFYNCGSGSWNTDVQIFRNDNGAYLAGHDGTCSNKSNNDSWASSYTGTVRVIVTAYGQQTCSAPNYGWITGMTSTVMQVRQATTITNTTNPSTISIGCSKTATVSITNGSSPTVTWTNTQGTGTWSGTTYTPTSLGDHTIRATVGACTSDLTFNVITFPAIAAINNGPVCSGSNASLTATGLAPSGNAINFSGGNFSYIDVPNTASYNVTQNLTVEAWIKPASGLAGGAIIFNKENQYEAAVFADGSLQWAYANTTPGWAWINTGYIVPWNTWSHVAFVHDYTNSSFKTYVNGVLVHTYAIAGVLATTTSSFRIGNRSSNSPFTGAIDNVRLWNVARTASEIAQNFIFEYPTTVTGLVAHYPLNGNANAATGVNGTLTGAGTSWIAPAYYSYTWAGPGTITPNNTTSETVTATTAGNYTVAYTVPGYCISTASAPTTVSLATAPAILTQPLSAQACPGGNVTVSVTHHAMDWSDPNIWDFSGNITWDADRGAWRCEGYCTMYLKNAYAPPINTANAYNIEVDVFRTLSASKLLYWGGQRVNSSYTNLGGYGGTYDYSAASAQQPPVGMWKNYQMVGKTGTAASTAGWGNDGIAYYKVGGLINYNGASSEVTYVKNIRFYTGNTHYFINGPSTTYQWKKNGTNISGATSSSYTMTGVTAANAGTYTVNVTSCGGTTTSDAAAVIINPTPTTPTITVTSGTTTGCGALNATLVAGSSIAGNALDLNGSSSYDLGNPAALQITGSMTVEMWLRPTDMTQRRNPWGKAYGGEGTITLEPGGTLNFYWGTGAGNAAPYTGFNSGAAVILNQWNHVAVVRNMSTNMVYWYINGVQTNSMAAPYGGSASSLSATIGSNYTGYGYVGQMDELRVWNVARTAAEIQNNMNTVVAPFQSSLAGYWRMDETTGNITDASGSNVVSTASGAPTYTNSTAPLEPTYAWTPTTQLSPTTGSTVVTTATASRTYTVTATPPFGCSTSNNTVAVTVSPVYTATAAGPNTVCQSASPAAITLSGASVGSGATTGAWSIISGGGTLSSTAQTSTPATP
ncbi:hypothetical protein BH09BAC1_BH09BAC1_17960 [soil metagenome]